MARKSKPTLSAEALAWLVEYWKMVTLAVLILIGIGIRFETWQSSLARADDVDSSMKSMKVDIKSDLNLIRQQLFEIAKTTGARQIAPSTNEGIAP
jgi:hypothetical protein